MAIDPDIIIDGFEMYLDMSTEGVGLISTYPSVSGTYTFIEGRFGGRAVWVQLGNQGAMRRALPAQYNKIAIGIAIKFDNFGGQSASGTAIIEFEDVNGATQYAIGVTDLGQIKAFTSTNFSSATLIGDKSFNAKVWHFLEVELVSDNAAGEIRVYLDGDEVINASGVDTQGSGTSNLINVVDSRPVNSSARAMDDYYIRLNSATRIGESRVEQYLPASDFAVDFTPLSGSDNYAMVDESVVDSDTTYNSGNTPGDKDLFTMETITSNPDIIHCVQLANCYRKEESGTRTIHGVIADDTGASEDDGVDFNLTQTYQFDRQHWTQNPFTEAAWDLGDFPLKMGYELVL